MTFEKPRPDLARERRNVASLIANRLATFDTRQSRPGSLSIKLRNLLESCSSVLAERRIP